MNFATSTERAELSTDAARDRIKPWHFFTLAALACATAATYLARGRGPEVVVLQIVLMLASAVVALAVLNTVRPLLGAKEESDGAVGGRTHAALEREKTLTMRAIKELEFDRAMGKLSDSDFAEMSSRLRARAGRLMRQLDLGSEYRDQIERDLEAKLASSAAGDARQAVASRQAVPSAVGAHACPACETANDADARFCKSCGARL